MRLLCTGHQTTPSMTLTHRFILEVAHKRHVSKGLKCTFEDGKYNKCLLDEGVITT